MQLVSEFLLSRWLNGLISVIPLVPHVECSIECLLFVSGALESPQRRDLWELLGRISGLLRLIIIHARTLLLSRWMEDFMVTLAQKGCGYSESAIKGIFPIRGRGHHRMVMRVTLRNSSKFQVQLGKITSLECCVVLRAHRLIVISEARVACLIIVDHVHLVLVYNFVNYSFEWLLLIPDEVDVPILTLRGSSELYVGQALLTSFSSQCREAVIIVIVQMREWSLFNNGLRSVSRMVTLFAPARVRSRLTYRDWTEGHLGSCLISLDRPPLRKGMLFHIIINFI